VGPLVSGHLTPGPSKGPKAGRSVFFASKTDDGGWPYLVLRAAPDCRAPRCWVFRDKSPAFGVLLQNSHVEIS